jgi:hypothetical protein
MAFGSTVYTSKVVNLSIFIATVCLSASLFFDAIRATPRGISSLIKSHLTQNDNTK